MIRFSRLSMAKLDSWLVDQKISSASPSYRLRLWHGSPAALPAILEELKAYIQEGLEDARMRLRRGFEDDLSPFNSPVTDPAANFPALLHKVTLQGYLGETLAAMAVEHWGYNGQSDWVVPAFLFRFHAQEFQHLDMINQTLAVGQPYDADEAAQKRPGRTGDDNLAFRIDGSNVITDVLAIEAKCLATNNAEKITDAHEKLAAGLARPSGIRELVELLGDYDTAPAQLWQEALLKLWKKGYLQTNRHDAVTYICSNKPVKGTRKTWLPPTAPHPSYTATRRLEGFEFHIDDLQGLINVLYRDT